MYMNIMNILWTYVHFMAMLHSLLHNVTAAVSSGLAQVSLVYLDIEMIQPGKSFLKFDRWLKQGVQ